MNGKRAKLIRRQVYGDNVSNVSGRQYTVTNLARRLFKWTDKGGKKIERSQMTVTVETDSNSLRRKYQQAKRDWRLRNV